MVLYSHFFNNFSQFVVIHRVKAFSINNEEEVDVFFFSEIPLFSLESKENWQFDLWFLCLFETQIVHF